MDPTTTERSRAGDPSATVDSLTTDFIAAGIRPGAAILVHSSLSSLGHVCGGARAVIDALISTIGSTGTLCIPTLSYLFVDAEHPVFDVRSTPTNLGAIPEAFRRREGVVRSMHPTHSVAAFGPAADAITGEHWRDTTPVGKHSPFSRMREFNGQVVFLGCGARCNTSIHGVEEALPVGPPPYLLQPGTIAYTVIDADGHERVVQHRRHNFSGVGQRYERLAAAMPPGTYREGRAGVGGAALVQVFDAAAMWMRATELLTADPLALVESVPEGEGHFLVRGVSSGDGASCGAAVWRYRVGPVA